MYFFDYDPGVPMYRYLGKDSLEEELDNSLKRLNTDYIDLYQTHWQDPTTPIDQTMEFLMEAKQKGKIRAIGVSNANLQQIKEYTANGVLDADQEKYSLIDLEVAGRTYCHGVKKIMFRCLHTVQLQKGFLQEI